MSLLYCGCLVEAVCTAAVLRLYFALTNVATLGPLCQYDEELAGRPCFAGQYSLQQKVGNKLMDEECDFAVVAFPFLFVEVEQREYWRRHQWLVEA